MKTSQKEAIKEANKLVIFLNDYTIYFIFKLLKIIFNKGFKRVEQNKRNQIYHDRLLIEEAIRKTNQEQALISHNKQLKKENYREAKGQKEASMNKFVSENNSAFKRYFTYFSTIPRVNNLLSVLLCVLSQNSECNELRYFLFVGVPHCLTRQEREKKRERSA